MSQSLLQDKDLFYDAEELWEHLTLKGYTEDEIESALAYIESVSLKVPGPFWSADMPVYRSHSPEERSQISPRARGYLWTLKSRGIIDHELEDEIIQKAMNLERHAGVKEIKTVAALTIFGYEHRGHDDPNRVDSGSSRYH